MYHGKSFSVHARRTGPESWLLPLLATMLIIPEKHSARRQQGVLDTFFANVAIEDCLDTDQYEQQKENHKWREQPHDNYDDASRCQEQYNSPRILQQRQNNK